MVSLQAVLAATLISATSSQTVLLDFCADWCQPCRSMNPTIQALIQEGYPVQKVNIDQYPQLKQEYGVTSIPCFIMLSDGREIGRVVGGTSFSHLERMCKQGLAARSPPELAGAPAPKSGSAGAIPIPVTEEPTGRMMFGIGFGSDAGLVGTSPPSRGASPSSLPSSGLGPRVSQASFTEPVAKKSAAAGPSGWAPVRGDPVASKNALIASSVRLRIADPRGHSCGSGTIIDARDGEALILTCGHIFRDSHGKGQIDVDLFGPAAAEKVPGRLISYDLKSDLGLVAIRIAKPANVAPVAPLDYRTKEGDAVVSVGCNNGDRPSVRHSRVTALDKYQGPANVEVAGIPVEGRSGGGLFSSNGKVIGVCFAADPRDKEGLYAGLRSIHAQLDKAELGFVYRTRNAPGPTPAATPDRRQIAKISIPAKAPTRTPTVTPTMPREFPSRPAQAMGQMPSHSIGAAEQATLDEIRRRLAEGAEVICLVRPPRRPNAKSEITLLERISPQFLDQLAAEARLQNKFQPTSLEIPQKRSRPRAVVPVARLSQAGADNANGWRAPR